MILSKQLEFSDEQKITASAASTNVIDLGGTGSLMKPDPFLRDVGRGTKIPLLIQVTEKFSGATSMNVEIQTCDRENFASGVVTHAKTVDVAGTDLKVGRVYEWDTVPIARNSKRMGRNRS